jgi:tetratricopeptide (TPR) repeat protein
MSLETENSKSPERSYPGSRQQGLAIICGLIALLASPLAAAETQDAPLKQLIDELRTTTAIEDRDDVCHRFLRSGQLSRQEVGLVYGILGSIAFEIAVGILGEAGGLDGLTPGELTAMLDELEKSIRQYNTSLAINPDFSPNYFHRGFSYELGGNLEKALEDYTQTVTRDPTFAAGYLYRARALSIMGRREEAMPDLEKALELELDDAQAQLARKMLHELQASP